MREPVWVLPEVVVAVHQMLLAEHGGLLGIRNEALLDSTSSGPAQRFTYGDGLSIFDLAASYCYGLAKNHPYVDGNKRVALAVAAIFIELNRYSLDATEAETVVIIELLAAGHLTEEKLASWFTESCILNV